MKIGYLGPLGTFSEYSAYKIAQNKPDSVLIPYPSILDVLRAVEEGEVEEGIVPIENSIEGAVNTTIDALIFDTALFITKELVLPISQSLMTKEGTEKKEIVKILSHPQGLAQSGKYLRTHFPNALLSPVNSTAEAAKIVAGSKENWAAVAHKRAAEIYQLKIIAEHIEEDTFNATRFVLLSKKPNEAAKQNTKTSIIFSTQNKPGELYKILDILSIWDINMTKIESRPMKHQLGTYVFFVDLETDSPKDLSDALSMIQRKTSFFKNLGSYSPCVTKPYK